MYTDDDDDMLNAHIRTFLPASKNVSVWAHIKILNHNNDMCT